MSYLTESSMGHTHEWDGKSKWTSETRGHRHLVEDGVVQWNRTKRHSHDLVISKVPADSPPSKLPPAPVVEKVKGGGDPKKPVTSEPKAVKPKATAPKRGASAARPTTTSRKSRKSSS